MRETIKSKRELSVFAWSAVAGIAAVVATIVLFLPAVQFSYTNLDDYHYIFYNKETAAGITYKGLVWAWKSVAYGGIWMPLTWFSYMADITAFGSAPGVYHATNIVLHGLAAGLFFWLLNVLVERLATGVTLRRRLGAALVATLFWSLHPLRVEPVVWIASRKDVLCCFWELAALLLWAKLVLAVRLRWRVVYYMAAVVAFALAGMAKPSAMTWPLLVMGVELLLTRRIEWKRLWLPLAMAVALGYVAAVSQRAGGATVELAGVPLYGRLANAIAALGTYCWKTVWPTALAVPYLHCWPQWPLFLGWGGVICLGLGMLWLAVCAVALQGVVRLPLWLARLSGALARALSWPARLLGVAGAALALAVFVGLTWFVVVMGPTLGLANFGYHSHADRFTYVAALGLSLPLALFWAQTRRRVVAAALAAALLPLALATRTQAGLWRNDNTLFSHTLAVTGENFMAHRNLAIYFYSQHYDHEAAIRHVSRALELATTPNNGFRSWYVLLLAESGQIEAAAAEAALLAEMAQSEHGKKDISTFFAFAAVAWFEGERELALEHCATILQRVPDHPDANYLMGVIALDEGRTADAITYWERATDGDFHYAFVKRRLQRLRELNK